MSQRNMNNIQSARTTLVRVAEQLLDLAQESGSTAGNLTAPSGSGSTAPSPVASDTNTGKKLIASLLMFITGSFILGNQLQVQFNTDPSKPLLEADSCFNRVILPTCHSNYQGFKEACIRSLSWGAKGYGRF